MKLHTGEKSSLIGRLSTVKNELPIEVYNGEGRSSQEFINAIGFGKIYAGIGELKVAREAEDYKASFTQEDAIELLDELL